MDLVGDHPPRTVGEHLKLWLWLTGTFLSYFIGDWAIVFFGAKMGLDWLLIVIGLFVWAWCWCMVFALRHF